MKKLIFLTFLTISCLNSTLLLSMEHMKSEKESNDIIIKDIYLNHVDAKIIAEFLTKLGSSIKIEPVQFEFDGELINKIMLTGDRTEVETLQELIKKKDQYECWEPRPAQQVIFCTASDDRFDGKPINKIILTGDRREVGKLQELIKKKDQSESCPTQPEQEAKVIITKEIDLDLVDAKSAAEVHNKSNSSVKIEPNQFEFDRELMEAESNILF